MDLDALCLHHLPDWQISTTKSSKNHGILFLEFPACALPSLLNSRILQRTPPKQIHPPCLPNNVPAHASQLSRLGYGQGQLCFPSELYTSAWSLGNHRHRLQLGCVRNRWTIMKISWKILRMMTYCNKFLQIEAKYATGKVWSWISIGIHIHRARNHFSSHADSFCGIFNEALFHSQWVMNMHFPEKRYEKNHERTQIDPHPSRGCESFLQPPMSYPTALEFCQRCVSPRTTSPAPLVVLDAWWSPFAYDVRSFWRKVSSASANVQPRTIIHHNSFRCQRTIPWKSSIVIQEAKS